MLSHTPFNTLNYAPLIQYTAVYFDVYSGSINGQTFYKCTVLIVQTPYAVSDKG